MFISSRVASRSILLDGAVAAAPFPGRAASPTVPDTPLQTIVVTATRVPVPLAEVLAPVLVIDRDTIERSAANDAADLLRFHAGLDLARTGGPGQPTSVFIRGADSNHTLVLIDGVRVNPGTIGLPALQNVTPDMIERIEVVKGPRSALWGTDAIGGVINVVTRRGSRDGWVVEAGYGDYDTRRAALNGGIDLGARSALDFGVSWLDSDGFPTRTIDDVERGFENLNANLQWRANLGAAELALRHWQATGTSEYSDFYLTPVDQDFATATTAAELRVPVGDRGAVARLAVSHLDDEIDQNQSPDYLRTRRDTVEAQYDWDVGRSQALGVGAMFYTEDAGSVSYGSALRAETNSVSAFVQDQFTHGPHLALLALGYTDHETAGSAVTWNVEYGHAFNEGRTRAYALSGAGFRAPDATDRYGFGGNPDLKPERSRNYEIGLRHALSARQSIELSAFRTDIEDLIEYVVTDFETFAGTNENVAEARIRGIEAGWQYTGDTWQAHVATIHQQPRNRTDDTPLLRRADRSLTAGVTRAFGPVQIGVEMLAAGERKDVGFPTPVTLDSYVLVNLSAQWQATPSLALVARVENLLDEDYELANTYNTPDRGLYFTVRYAPPKSKDTAQTASLRR